MNFSLSKFSIVISETFGYYFDSIFSGIKDMKKFEESISFLSVLGYNGVELPLMMRYDDLIHVCKNIIPNIIWVFQLLLLDTIIHL